MGAEWLSNPDERIHVARDLRRAGKSLDEIVLETGLSRWNVSKACADIVSVWKREHPMRAEIERLLAEERTARDVAGALSVDDKTVAMDAVEAAGTGFAEHGGDFADIPAQTFPGGAEVGARAEGAGGVRRRLGRKGGGGVRERESSLPRSRGRCHVIRDGGGRESQTFPPLRRRETPTPPLRGLREGEESLRPPGSRRRRR
mgnify:CR=1 FL=1